MKINWLIWQQKIDLGQYILLGKGELQTRGWEKKSILANTYEALIAAIYLDAGFDGVYIFIRTHFSELIDSVDTLDADRDFKSRLQELVQETRKTVPQYSVVTSIGPDHDRTFKVQVTVDTYTALGEGKSKKAAEQEAARKVLEQLSQE